MPEISVLMCVYNRHEYLAAAMDSISNQTFKDFEFVIVNDGSDEVTTVMMKSYAQKDPRVIYVENQQNLGIVRSVTRGLEYCSGRYIARMDSDDISHPERLQKQYDFLEAHPEIDAVGAGLNFIDGSGAETGKFLVRISDPMLIRHEMFYHCVIHNPVSLARASYYKQYNQNHAEEGCLAADDYHFWMRMNFDHLYSNLPDRLLQYRVHSQNATAIFFAPQMDEGIQTAKEGFERLLARKIPDDVIRTFYFIRRFTTEDPKIALQAMRVVYDAQKAFERQNHLTDAQQRQTRLYTYEKLKSVLSKYKKYPQVILSGTLLLFKLLPQKLIRDLMHKNREHTDQ